MAKTLYNIMNELGIRICPICGKEYTEHPAISRKDNVTETCPECGIKEALDAFLTSETDKVERKTDYCIFKKRFCKLARSHGNTFTCTAKDDEEMICKYK